MYEIDQVHEFSQNTEGEYITKLFQYYDVYMHSNANSCVILDIMGNL